MLSNTTPALPQSSERLACVKAFAQENIQVYPQCAELPYFIFKNATPEGSSFLQTAHTRLVGVLMSQGTNVSDNTLEAYPTQAVVALWDPSVSWAGGAWHFWKDTNASTITNVASVQPFPKLRLFVANEAYAKYPP
ncbi:g7795 [Coccomyxa elongata]